MPDSLARERQRTGQAGSPEERARFLRDAERRGNGPAVKLLALCGDPGALVLYPRAIVLHGKKGRVPRVAAHVWRLSQSLTEVEGCDRATARCALACFEAAAAGRMKRHRKSCWRCGEGAACRETAPLDQIRDAVLDYLHRPSTRTHSVVEAAHALTTDGIPLWGDCIPAWADCIQRAWGNPYELMALLRERGHGRIVTAAGSEGAVRAAVVGACVRRANQLIERW